MQQQQNFQIQSILNPPVSSGVPNDQQLQLEQQNQLITQSLTPVGQSLQQQQLASATAAQNYYQVQSAVPQQQYSYNQQLVYGVQYDPNNPAYTVSEDPSHHDGVLISNQQPQQSMDEQLQQQQPHASE